jgi:hypothetical protein
MPPRSRKIVLGVVAVLLLALTLWLANQAMAHWFFADFHNESAKGHESWGNRFALLALILLLGFLYALRLLVKKKSAV